MIASLVLIDSNPQWRSQLWRSLVWSKKTSMLDRGKLTLGADVEDVLSLSPLIRNATSNSAL